MALPASAWTRSRAVGRWSPWARARQPEPRAYATVAVAPAVSGTKRLKSFDDLPGPSLVESLYRIFVKGYVLRTHELQVKHTFDMDRFLLPKDGRVLKQSLKNKRLEREKLKKQGNMMPPVWTSV